MNFFVLSALTNTITVLFLGFFVYYKNKRSQIGKDFALLCLTATFWSLCYFLWQTSPDKSSALFWTKALTFFATFLPLTQLRFVYNLLKIKHNIFLTIFLYLYTISASILSFTTLFVVDVEPIKGFEHWPVAGPLYGYYLVVWIAIIAYVLYLLISHYIKSKKPLKTFLLYLIIASLIGYIGGITNYPLWFGIEILPWGNVFIAMYVVVLAYAITHQNALNVKIIKTESILFMVFALLLIDALVSDSWETLLIRLVLLSLFIFVALKFIESSVELDDANSNLDSANRKLKQANGELKLLGEAKDDFLSMASHELNTPISAIEGYLSMILDEGMGEDLGPKNKKYLTTVYASAKRLAHLVEDLLNVSRIEAGRIHIVYTEAHIEDVVEQAALEIDSEIKKHKHSFKISKPKVKTEKFWMDVPRITEVVINLIGNSIKYTPDGGKIELRIQKINGDIQVSVTDTGKGIPEDKKGRIFKKFTQAQITQDENKGTGLGLFISKNLIEMHKGKIWFESTEGKGTTFFFSIPIIKERPADPHEGEGAVLH